MAGSYNNGGNAYDGLSLLDKVIIDVFTNAYVTNRELSLFNFVSGQKSKFYYNDVSLTGGLTVFSDNLTDNGTFSSVQKQGDMIDLAFPVKISNDMLKGTVYENRYAPGVPQRFEDQAEHLSALSQLMAGRVGRQLDQLAILGDTTVATPWGVGNYAMNGLVKLFSATVGSDVTVKPTPAVGGITAANFGAELDKMIEAADADENLRYLTQDRDPAKRGRFYVAFDVFRKGEAWLRNSGQYFFSPSESVYLNGQPVIYRYGHYEVVLMEHFPAGTVAFTSTMNITFAYDREDDIRTLRIQNLNDETNPSDIFQNYTKFLLRFRFGMAVHRLSEVVWYDPS